MDGGWCRAAAAEVLPPALGLQPLWFGFGNVVDQSRANATAETAAPAFDNHRISHATPLDCLTIGSSFTATLCLGSALPHFLMTRRHTTPTLSSREIRGEGKKKK
jgi:hypothetical protein